jgi:hypothetical protein
MIDKKYNKQYKIMHNEGWYDGRPKTDEWIIAKKLFDQTGCKTLLDFGCGKAKHWRPMIVRPWGKLKPTYYDPAVPRYSTLPLKHHDMIMSTDCLEHIPEHILPKIIRYCTQKARKANFHFIDCGLAKKFLPNGENAHCTIQSADWWAELFETHAVQKIPTILTFAGSQRGKSIIKLWNRT